MRVVVIGVEGDDQSRVVRVKEVLADQAPGDTTVRRVGLFSTTGFPPDLRVPPRPASEEVTGFKGDERTSGFLVVKFPARYQGRLHRTDTLDYEAVLDGRITIHADVGSADLEPGDLVVIPGLRHYWSTGEEGATIAVSWVGLAPG